MQEQAVVHKLISDIAWIWQFPEIEPDQPYKTYFNADVLVARIFKDDSQWIIYYFEAETMIVANIGTILEPPRLFRENKKRPWRAS